MTKKSKVWKKESDLMRAALGWLNSQPGCFFFKVHGGQYQQSGIPDLIGHIQGVFVGIELKIGNNRPTQLQSHMINTILDTGGYACICYNLDDVEKHYSRIITHHVKA